MSYFSCSASKQVPTILFFSQLNRDCVSWSYNYTQTDQQVSLTTPSEKNDSAKRERNAVSFLLISLVFSDLLAFAGPLLFPVGHPVGEWSASTDRSTVRTSNKCTLDSALIIGCNTRRPFSNRRTGTAIRTWKSRRCHHACGTSNASLFIF